MAYSKYIISNRYNPNHEFTVHPFYAVGLQILKKIVNI